MTSGVPPEPPLSLVALFGEEAEAHISALHSALAGPAWSGSSAEVAALVSGLRAESHGLVGAALAVGLDAIAELMRAVEVACAGLMRAGVAPQPALRAAIADAVDAAEVLVGAAVAGVEPAGSVDVAGLIAAVAAASG